MLNQKLNRGGIFSFVPFPDFQLKFKIIKFQHRSYLNFCLFVQNECQWVADVVLIKNLTLFIYDHFDAIYRFIIDWDTIHDDDTNFIRRKKRLTMVTPDYECCYAESHVFYCYAVCRGVLKRWFEKFWKNILN